ncbi:hypothetical protein SCHPADRAFT_686659 [Schizopora paradoxa]|uniref:Uncharacterized protein n=1 Tax=Schizopora paradoxa TaxID=27342 RepID=A0A0H2RAN4_9AGAM|nr:hypothetical protein SCHPADRAFT_686659 [Schizopora paradoxa]
MGPHPTSLLSLPDEILSKCFELAFEGDNKGGSFLSLGLSHLSRRCRVVALKNANIWTSLQHDRRLRSLEFTKGCIARSKQLPLTVVVSFTSGPVHATDFLALLGQRVCVERCRRVVLIYHPDHVEEGLPGSEVGSEHFSSDAFLARMNPECLVLRLDWSQSSIDPNLDEYHDKLSPAWSRAFLIRMADRIKHLTLSTLPGLHRHVDFYIDSLSSFHLVIEDNLYIPATEFLRLFRSLEDLKVTMTLFSPTSSIDTYELFYEGCVSFPSIRNLHFRIYVDHDPQQDFDKIRFPLNDCLFPNAVKMNLHLEFQVFTSSYEVPLHGSEWKFRSLVESIFPNDRRCPSLEQLSVTFRIANRDGISAVGFGPKFQTASTIFPLKCLPHLKHLEIRSDLRLSVHTSILDYLQRIKVNFPALLSLKLWGSQLKLYKWTGLVLQILKEQGSWETFEELVVPTEMALPGTSYGVLRGEAISEWIRAKVNPKWEL